MVAINGVLQLEIPDGVQLCICSLKLKGNGCLQYEDCIIKKGPCFLLKEKTGKKK